MSEELASIDPEEIELRVWHLRRGGLVVHQIAEHMGIPPAEVIEHYNSYRNKLARSTMSRDEAKDLLTARYEGLIAGWYDSAANGDEVALKAVTPLLRDEMKLFQLDQLDPNDRAVTQNILVIGDDKKSFIAALRAGRGQVDTDEIMDAEEEAG